MDYQLIEVSSCPVCYCNEYKIVFRKDKFCGKQCNECRLVYLSPRIKNLDNVYTDDRTSSTSKYYKFAIDADRRIFAKRLELIEGYVKKGAFLDIGCSIGTFLEVAKAGGWDSMLGIEPNPNSALVCKEKGLSVINNFFGSDLAGTLQKFDAVYIGDVIEHLADPKEILQNIYRILKPNGIVMIVTPNFDSLAARLLQIKPFEHILYFTKTSMMHLIEMTDFKIEKITTTTRDRSIKAMVYSTTFSTIKGKLFVKFIASLHADKLINIFLKLFVRDEILVIARKK